MKRSWIYFVQVGGDDGPIKVGLARNVRRRFYELQCANPQRLRYLGRIEGDRNREQELHREYRALKIRGEWFSAARGLFEVAGTELPARYRAGSA